MKLDIPDRLVREIVTLARKYKIEKLLLFGSRARGTNHPRSDIDLAVAGGDVLGFSLEVEDNTDTLLSFDVVNLDEGISAELQKEIDRDGIDMYELGGEMKKYQAFAGCLKVLEQVDMEMSSRNEIYRMGVIGQFNLTFELAWKALKEVLTLYGVAEAATGSPREIFKAAYGLGWLTDEKVWLEMLKNRNVAIHVYDEEKAQVVLQAIFDKYVGGLQELRDKLEERLRSVSA
ncbi:MAG: nucleotidyltransferase substrate binding protein [Selenomonas sp.]|nr:nucleotidyltransferase substrate binding protein [Selenomonas sp.]